MLMVVLYRLLQELPPDLANFLNGFVLFGVPLLLATPLIIEGLKRVLGMPTHWSGVASLVINVIAAVLIYVVKAWPALEDELILVWMVVLATFAVPGLYSQIKLFVKGNPTHPGETPQVVGAPSDNKEEDDIP